MGIRALVLRTAGTNCDEETVYALRLADANPDSLHINQLRRDPAVLLDYRMLVIPGGFSYGDDISAGKVLALELELFLKNVLLEFLDRGGLILGICNGFQVLVKAGLLPAMSGYFTVEASLVENDSGLFVDRWVELEVCRRDLPWTHLLTADRLRMPVAHAEGKFVASENAIHQLSLSNQVVFRYAGGTNPNGSYQDIAGICDPSGQILGLMPHPERAVIGSQYPDWFGRVPYNRFMPPLDIFRSGVKWLEKS